MNQCRAEHPQDQPLNHEAKVREATSTHGCVDGSGELERAGWVGGAVSFHMESSFPGEVETEVSVKELLAERAIS